MRTAHVVVYAILYFGSTTSAQSEGECLIYNNICIYLFTRIYHRSIRPYLNSIIPYSLGTYSTFNRKIIIGNNNLSVRRNAFFVYITRNVMI